ncbi:MAG: phosphatidate cytidylyltransferase [Planctomycetaceae bacterium]|nr:phosphatidate cytidylyltransferase [Planctomycetaceae bacterium]
MDVLTNSFLCGVLLLLIAASCGVKMLRRYEEFGVDPAILDTFRSRLRAWWILFGSLCCVFMFGPLATSLLFFLLAIGILREYITLTPKSPVDHKTLFWIYIFFTPLQFILTGINPDGFESITGLPPYRFFSVLLPAYVFLVLPGFMAMSDDPKRFLERTAKLQLGLIVCVYAMSYAPALLTIDLPNAAVQQIEPSSPLIDKGVENTVLESIAPSYIPQASGKHFRLLFFFVVIVQFGDIFQYLWSQVSSRHIIAPRINMTRTWKGVLGGAATTALLGVLLWYFTPFTKWWQPGVIAFVTSLMGFCGNMTMSAIKRDRGVSGYGSPLRGYNGLLDRMDSLCFAAPVFYHLAWLFSR